MSIFTFRKNKEVLIHKIETVCECKCKCKCENILEYLKNKNPNDFCNYEKCLKFNNLLPSDCGCCSKSSRKFCSEHKNLITHHIIKCGYCDKMNCSENYKNDNWTFSEYANRYDCSCLDNKTRISSNIKNSENKNHLGLNISILFIILVCYTLITIFTNIGF
jgi:hypothetical protein